MLFQALSEMENEMVGTISALWVRAQQRSLMFIDMLHTITFV